MVVHQTPRKAARPAGLGRLGDQRQIGTAVVVGEEHRLAAVATLGDVMGDAWHDDAGKSGHVGGGNMGWGQGLIGIVSPELLKLLCPDTPSIGKFRIIFCEVPHVTTNIQ